jgi:anti-sigma B factor antagonist
MPLQIESRQVGKVTVVKCSGRIVAEAESDSLLEQVQRLMPSERHIVLHLGDVQFVDSTGLGTLVRLLTSLRTARGDLKLSNVAGTIAHTLKITNLCSILEMHDSDAEAIAAFYTPTATTEVLHSGTPILCVDRSCSVLAYLRELLMKAARPVAVIIGPDFGAMGDSGESFRRAVASVPVVELGQGFSTVEAGEGARHFLEQVRARVAKAS